MPLPPVASLLITTTPSRCANILTPHMPQKKTRQPPRKQAAPVHRRSLRANGTTGPGQHPAKKNKKKLVQRRGKKQWKDFHPSPEDVERGRAALDLEQEVSDLSEPDLPTTWESRTRTGQRASVVNGAKRHARADALKAQRHDATAEMRVFSLAEAVETRHGQPAQVSAVEPPGPITVLEGDKPRRVKSADGYDLIYHLPGAMREQSLAELVEAATEWGRACKPSQSVSSDKKGGYKEAGELVGTTRIVLAWHAIGHPHDEPGVSADVLRNRLTFNGACTLLEKLDLVNAYVMELVKTIDPAQYASLQQLYQWRMQKFPSNRALSGLATPQMFFEGREIQFNRYSKAHWDGQDPHWAWAIIIYFGTFGSCRLKFKQLRTELVLRPGDAVAIRGQDLLHEADDWDFGERHLLVHFTHRSLWNQSKIPLKFSRSAPYSG
ncbi:hypothetical protein K466DRAFT_567204 [Polyporus arcularius HHB13444]|uniref:Prolyl 4-hydroxylase alpha subunit domain-containing protein n=1 Tax=Polyporus arcularius HHB13444 TaxID=1314778 RepID=A0A5C3P6G2_9APHY|nr:hypothetical protein K466DRAFT_567204 [Polyporus arcularius HHB13444]